MSTLQTQRDVHECTPLASSNHSAIQAQIRKPITQHSCRRHLSTPDSHTIQKPIAFYAFTKHDCRSIHWMITFSWQAGASQPPPCCEIERHLHVRPSIASASQVLVSALERGHGRDAVSLFHQRSRPTPPAPGVARHRQGERDHCFVLARRSGFYSQLARCCCTLPKHWVSPRCASCGYPVANSAVMWPCKSLRFVSGPQHRFRFFDGPGMPVSARGVAAPRAKGCRGVWPVLRSVAVRALWRWV